MSDLILDSSSTSTVSLNSKDSRSFVELCTYYLIRVCVLMLAIVLSTWLTNITYTVTHSFVISISMGGIGFWLVCSFLLKERIETLPGSTASSIGQEQARPAVSKRYFTSPIVDERVYYCQGQLSSSQIVSLTLLYCGSFTEEAQEFYRSSKATSLDTFSIGNAPEYISVYGLIDSKGSRYMFLEVFTGASSLERGYFQQVDQWPSFGIHPLV
ncbi:hypothetical protein [Spirosoma agri]|uniref:Uncharacterized protein n=1 Tax=Spirosoma agri TaxID=1987381 RepID=A0A6M0IHT0_9BACT|nr:hypothetical protein [Spirosoma agri]NEU67830.1 hypothetical protein [Spirosoma agri]